MPEPGEAVLASEETLSTPEGEQKPRLDCPTVENDEKGAGPVGDGAGDVKKDQGQSSSDVEKNSQERAYYSGPRLVVCKAKYASPTSCLLSLCHFCWVTNYLPESHSLPAQNDQRSGAESLQGVEALQNPLPE